MRATAAPIGDYALVGDGRTTALVSRAGSIDWLCWPRPDSPSIFGVLIDSDAGFWRLCPVGESRAQRRYIEGTNVLETIFESSTGRVVVTDLMPVSSEEEKNEHFFADHEILRFVECERGTVEMEMSFAPRPAYGARRARLVDAGWMGLRMETGDGGLLLLRTDARLTVSAGSACGRTVLHAGESLHASLSWTRESPCVIPPIGAPTRAAIARTVAWWRSWSAGMTYEGPARDAVLRSALVLKLLAYAPSGAILAAPTTSLPERVGGTLNWDYRYCWLRDASLTVRALCGLGFVPEAEDFVEWLIHTHRSGRPRIVYDIYGCGIPRERELPLEGYRGSRPVRIGNDARGQLQLDVYGEVIDAAHNLVRAGVSVDRETANMLIEFGTFVARNWRTPDNGMWEPRGPRRMHTHSLLLCWVALDRLVDLHAKKHLRVADHDAFAAERDRIAATIRHFAWNDDIHAYTSVLGGHDLDASSLLLSWYGLEPASSFRMRSTWRRIEESLGKGFLLQRYHDGQSPGEGAFGICSFWGAEFLALGGGPKELADERFAALLRFGNDVGLFAEEIDLDTGEALGNFPQGFTHIGLINAALTIEKRREGIRERHSRAPQREEEAHT